MTKYTSYILGVEHFFVTNVKLNTVKRIQWKESGCTDTFKDRIKKKTF
jgi:hypothetical protein